jgi:hypothetical protein
MSRRADRRESTVGEPDAEAATVGAVELAFDVPGRLQPVEPVGHAGARQHRRRGQL